MAIIFMPNHHLTNEVQICGLFCKYKKEMITITSLLFVFLLSFGLIVIQTVKKYMKIVSDTAVNLSDNILKEQSLMDNDMNQSRIQSSKANDIQEKMNQINDGKSFTNPLIFQEKDEDKQKKDNLEIF